MGSKGKNNDERPGTGETELEVSLENEVLEMLQMELSD
jgi:hypothetical protein